MRKQSDYASYDPRYEEDQSPLARMVAEGELVKGGNIVPLPDKPPDCNLMILRDIMRSYSMRCVLWE